MTIISHIEELQYNISQSLGYFLNNQQYYRSGAGSYTSGTLKTFFSNPALKIILGYPDVLEKLDMPCLAVEEDDSGEYEDLAYGTDAKEYTFSYNIHGFCGGEASDNLNRRRKNELANDVKQLLEETEYIYYHEYPSFNSGSDLEVRNVRKDNLPIMGTTPADRHRFVISLDLVYIKN
jgi:Ca2+-binding RTX toxin-like protein